MDAKQIRDLYDDRYASVYEERFLFSELGKSDAAFEVEFLGQLLADGRNWLDVACGTGYFLSRFPDVRRAGLDLSPAMLSRARQVNPNVEFHERSFCSPWPEAVGRYGLVSCMWYAYGLVDSMAQMETAIGNLCDWTAADGALFLPFADPRLIAGLPLPYLVETTPWTGKVHITGITWSYAEDDGAKVHAHMLCPQVELLQSWLEARFARVEIINYPPALPGWEGVRRAFVCRDKR